MQLRYGKNPHQTPARVEPVHQGTAPIRVVAGQASYINVLDAVNAFALVTEASTALGRPAATSFKHVSPAGAAVCGPIDDVTCEVLGVGNSDSGRSLRPTFERGMRTRASYGDMIAVSEPVDDELAEALLRLPSDGIIAPGYEPGTVEKLAGKKSRRFLVLESDRTLQTRGPEIREIAGLRFIHPPDIAPSTLDTVAEKASDSGTELPDTAVRDLILGLITLRYTQIELCRLRTERFHARHRSRSAIPNRLHPPRRSES